MKEKQKYIELLDGTSLPYEEVKPMGMEMDEMYTTLSILRYLIAGRYFRGSDENGLPLRELFAGNAVALYDYADVILSDSRMFFAPIPLGLGCWEDGSKILKFPVVGMYIELWKHCPESTMLDEDGNRMVCCDWGPDYTLDFVGKNGEQCRMKGYHLWHTIVTKFREIHHRYCGMTRKCECQSLLQLLALMEFDGKTVIDQKPLIIHRMAREMARLDVLNRQVMADHARMKRLLHHHLLKEKEEELRAFLDTLAKRRAKVDAVVDAAHRQRVALRIMLRKGELDSKRYEAIWKPVNRKKRAAIATYNSFVSDTLHSLFPQERITLWEIDQYMKFNNKNS